MAWVKIPAEHHPLFLAALPHDPRIETLKMFGAVAAKVNGHLFAGLFGRSVMVMLGDADRAAALAQDGAAPFDPMGNGRVHGDKITLSEAVMDNADELRHWVDKAFHAALALPKKAAKTKATSTAKTKAPTVAAKKPTTPKRPKGR